MKRSPVVVILGHVDSGKTTILDFIRKTEIRHKEAGGITQSIGAYEISHPSVGGQKITFLDTPGHEAFSLMRGRGAKAADVAILVVAGDRGVEPQTKEAWRILQESPIPVIIAINKIDKEGVDVNRVKADLAQNGIMLEGYGGKVSWQAIAAKSGQGIPELLDLVLLTAEVENLTYEPDHPASGSILESRLDSRRGPVATVIVKDGVLKTGDKVFTLSARGKVKSLENFLGEKVNEINPSAPALILGWETLPRVGEEFVVGGQTITATVADGEKAVKEVRTAAINLILKADTAGGLEALSQIIGNLPEKDDFAVIDDGVGEITDGDVKNALANRALIAGFHVSVTKAALTLAKVQKVKIIASAVIYELVQLIEEELAAVKKPVSQGELEVLAVFGKRNDGQIVGGRVLIGEIKNNATLEIKRRNDFIGAAKIINLQKDKKDAAGVPAGNECGLLLGSEVVIGIGDILVSQ